MIQYRKIVGNINKTMIAKIFPIIALILAILVQYHTFSISYFFGGVYDFGKGT